MTHFNQRHSPPYKKADNIPIALQVTTPAPQELPPKFQELIDAAQASPNRSLLKLPETAKRSAMGESTIWRDVSRMTFVPPIRISIRSVAWIEAEVDALLAAKALISRTGAKVNLADFVTALIAA
ncbi:AlpA family phage regulatory protein [Pseudoduganella sp. FT26W]|uniref:AlpA family phage regulatory protein n=1 Tax=Duganella aquatilis TaxID=2666082 RepID=A0A844D630_9BURK|nr:AlpA family phage regulatory protein [Duganella aquatilis]MRW87538.1 AlpA family phage regulatory protein [Duganella aquatilis]